MGKTYAGILGCLAFSTTLFRGALGGLSSDDVLLTATLSLFAFAAIGWVIGSLAESTVVQAARTRFEAEMQSAQAESKAGRTSSA
jgi:preprotein translocase subunit SecD